ncbi:2-dehydro-3-deoxy-6-phosphogalactonate aldolase [Microvirga thermotolerans]|uniref:2-dehydro-3-deoxy-6-phosphogalactonate aldolase n=1 Tax=Microvirga thermotolerans TaxID=2651334 RepID=A0A5P9JXZ0_9HYPH|nr:2-dehydro-3-deoxy-6-phosphogalactonate aldolase [Microvirga thermotolerans]QFU16516.1 2-dehydro-3-deoxy-6-phosphogalactonate aldolase [Microvirga thermotolerans]
MFRDYLSDLPLIAILRGLKPEDAEAVGHVLVEAGFRIIEVPLNSPDPFRSIAILAKALPQEVLIGAGTVLDPEKVDGVRDVGGRLVVMPHSDPEVIRRAKEHRLYCAPGVATPTEAFAALKAGADAIKIFPAEAIPPAVVKAWRAVLPKETVVLPVGGIRPDTMEGYVAAGADGFGLGSALFAPGMTVEEIARNARAFAAAWRDLARR